MRFIEWLRRRWLAICLSLVPALLLGLLVGPLLYSLSHCWAAGNDCEAFSPVRIFLAYLLSWPILIMQFVPAFSHNDSLNPLRSGNPGLLILWAYYYFLVSGAEYLVKLRTKNRAERI
jgi:uncharacterized membrane protein